LAAGIDGMSIDAFSTWARKVAGEPVKFNWSKVNNNLRLSSESTLINLMTVNGL
jgi:hypothetical protein